MEPLIIVGGKKYLGVQTTEEQIQQFTFYKVKKAFNADWTTGTKRYNIPISNFYNGVMRLGGEAVSGCRIFLHCFGLQRVQVSCMLLSTPKSTSVHCSELHLLYLIYG